jgi:hypothetical protein
MEYLNAEAISVMRSQLMGSNLQPITNKQHIADATFAAFAFVVATHH